MSSDAYSEFLPKMFEWVQNILDAHKHDMHSVESFGFPRLPLYFSSDLLKETGVVIVDHPPYPPVSKWGLSEFASFEALPTSAITFLEVLHYAKRRRRRNSPLPRACTRYSMEGAWLR
jgi:hypothetical protein